MRFELFVSIMITKGGNWTNALKIDRRDSIIEYKYVAINSTLNKVRWEEGENRMLNLLLVKSPKREIYNSNAYKTHRF